MSKLCPIYGKAIYMNCLECESEVCKSNGSNDSKNRSKNYGQQKSKENAKEAKMDKEEKVHKIVIGIDQSYEDTGITVGFNGNIMKISDCNTRKIKSNSEVRILLKKKLVRVFSMMQRQANSFEMECETICIIERIRLQSQGFVNINYIKSIGALNAMIVDTAREYDIPVYSVDTRAWKSAVIGTSKERSNTFGIDPKKWPTILWLISKGYKQDIKEEVGKKKKKGVIEKLNEETGEWERYTYNDNKADSACICLYGFLPESKQLLQEEH